MSRFALIREPLPVCQRCNHRHRFLRKRDLKDPFKGFVEWHKDRTGEAVKPEHCECGEKENWLNIIILMDKCCYCNCPLHYDLLEEEYVL